MKISEQDERVSCHTKKITGQKITLEFPSVGATENLILAACLAEGVTWIGNAAKEPEIIGLCRFLRMAGATIEGEGTEHILIRGVTKLHSVEFTLCHDRIVLQTMGLLVSATGGSVILHTGEENSGTDI